MRTYLSFTTRLCSDQGNPQLNPLPPSACSPQCSHDTAEDNLVLKLVKAPEREWGSNPTPTKATEVASKIDDLLGIAAAAAAGARETGAAARGGVRPEDPPAPGYEGSSPAQADVLRNSLAYEIE